MEKEQKIAELKDRLEDYFYTRWKNLGPSGEYSVSASTVNNKNKYTYVGVLADKEGQRDVYYLKCYHKNTLLRVYNNREALVADGYVTLPYNNGMELICLPTEKPFATFTINGYKRFNDNTFAEIENLQFYTGAWKNIDVPFTQLGMERVNVATMQEIADSIKFRDCHRLEEFAEGTELVISGIKEDMHRSRIRYILKLDNINVFFTFRITG